MRFSSGSGTTHFLIFTKVAAQNTLYFILQFADANNPMYHFFIILGQHIFCPIFL